MEQTAVQWLEKNLHLDMNFMEIMGVIRNAKSKEREQLKEAWNDGNFLGRNGNILPPYGTGEQYVVHTYCEYSGLPSVESYENS